MKSVIAKSMTVKSVAPSTALLLLCLSAAPAFSQQLLQPAVQPSPQPASRDNGIGPQLKAQPTATPQVQASPAQRPQSSSPVPSVGPANDASPPSRKSGAPAGPGAKVQDAAGVPLNGYIQVAPNRVYDPATKRYHWTAPSGGQQKIVK